MDGENGASCHHAVRHAVEESELVEGSACCHGINAKENLQKLLIVSLNLAVNKYPYLQPKLPRKKVPTIFLEV
jgi:hypothetical protein